MVITTVFATTSIVGFHFWEEAPEEVRYLRELHRHNFHIRVELSVVENDREVEFHTLKRDLHAWLGESPDFNVATGERNFREMSCEMIATAILDWLRSQYPGRELYRVMVNEDDENGAVVAAMEDRLSTYDREFAETVAGR